MSSGLYQIRDKNLDTTLDLTRLKPYGDTMNDGKVQTSFTLPVKDDDRGAAAAVLVGLFFRTRLGLSIRATGDNADMVRASSINPAFTITVGLCVANSLTGLAGCLTGLVNKSCDINLGTGMVTVALASLIIGETMFGRLSIGLRILGVIVGSSIYRIIIAVALAANVPTECFKLVSALIVAVAIAMPQGRKLIALQRQKLARRKEGAPC